jgi:predicted esterase
MDPGTVRWLNLWLGLAALAAVAGCERGRPAATDAPHERVQAPTSPIRTGLQSSAEPATTQSAASAEVDAAVTKWPPDLPPPVATDWCIPSVQVLDEETCVVLPERPSRQLLIYLHGIVPPTKDSVQKTNFETVVASAARRANVIALIPRGEKGFAPKGHAGWWGWPTSKASFSTRGTPFVKKLEDKKRKVVELLGREVQGVYVAGSSSGAYFVVALALHGAFEADGFGAMSGGVFFETTELDSLAPKPFYVGFGNHDSVAGGARALGKRLESKGWPTLVRGHATGHGAREVYLDEAFAFWLKGPTRGSGEKSRSD